jgi:hypothetical protein
VVQPRTPRPSWDGRENSPTATARLWRAIARRRVRAVRWLPIPATSSAGRTMSNTRLRAPTRHPIRQVEPCHAIIATSPRNPSRWSYGSERRRLVHALRARLSALATTRDESRGLAAHAVSCCRPTLAMQAATMQVPYRSGDALADGGQRVGVARRLVRVAERDTGVGAIIEFRRVE